MFRYASNSQIFCENGGGNKRYSDNAMKIINEFIKWKFNINCTLLKIGYYGEKNILSQLSKQEIYEYSKEILNEIDEEYDLIVQLISAYDDYEFSEILNKLAREENVDYDIQLRKWIVYLVNKELTNISKDYFEGLMQLTELWISLGLPVECPHIIQGKNNTISPEEYYTKETYELLLEKNIKWVNDEIFNINMLEKK